MKMKFFITFCLSVWITGNNADQFDDTAVDQFDDTAVDQFDDTAVNSLEKPETSSSAEKLSSSVIIHRPGHTLLKPSDETLMSSISYPKKSKQFAVYGNNENLGVVYGKTFYRVPYSSFRKSLLKLLNNFRRNTLYKRPIIVVVKGKGFLARLQGQNRAHKKKLNLIEKYNFPDRSRHSWVYTSEDSSEAKPKKPPKESVNPERSIPYWYRRSKKSKKRKKDKQTSSETSDSSESSSSSDSSSDKDKNPGNPYTIHKDKYYQNWLWNFEMTGDHMNLNPNAPVYQDSGPGMTNVFYGRKWWYYNQDDYLPLR